MNRKELTKKFVMISNWKAPFFLQGLYIQRYKGWSDPGLEKRY